MTPIDESFVHYIGCIDSLNRAWSILQDLGSVERPSALHSAAFRFALIEYAKPYTRSDGKHKKHILIPPKLPAKLLSLHTRIMGLRHQVLAHSDLTLKEARLHVHSYAGKPYHIIASNLPEALPDREEVITLIEQTLDQMYVESDRRLQSLPVEP
jgi:hypothetical protein